ncbi:hypothetical protein [Streptomyces liliifuscus]|uniref:hypothetical protein n=1 Tax=Streptomyces liliifuscus TaxID=2797636 RepID=UPI002D7FB1C3|nr:hypothetical protein [Streptomyces liliifuscus]
MDDVVVHHRAGRHGEGRHQVLDVGMDEPGLAATFEVRPERGHRAGGQAGQPAEARAGQDVREAAVVAPRVEHEVEEAHDAVRALSVAGYDDALSRPACFDLTTVSQNAEEQARQAVTAAVQRLDH